MITEQQFICDYITIFCSNYRILTGECFDRKFTPDLIESAKEVFNTQCMNPHSSLLPPLLKNTYHVSHISHNPNLLGLLNGALDNILNLFYPAVNCDSTLNTTQTPFLNAQSNFSYPLPSQNFLPVYQEHLFQQTATNQHLESSSQAPSSLPSTPFLINPDSFTPEQKILFDEFLEKLYSSPNPSSSHNVHSTNETNSETRSLKRDRDELLDEDTVATEPERKRHKSSFI